MAGRTGPWTLLDQPVEGHVLGLCVAVLVEIHPQGGVVEVVVEGSGNTRNGMEQHEAADELNKCDERSWVTPVCWRRRPVRDLAFSKILPERRA